MVGSAKETLTVAPVSLMLDMSAVAIEALAPWLTVNVSLPVNSCTVSWPARIIWLLPPARMRLDLP